MGQKWEEFLNEGSYKGVKFDFVSTRDQGGNILDAQAMPGRPGVFIEPRTRKELRFEIMAVFIEDDYPDAMFSLLDKLIDPTPGEFIHPVHGKIQVAADNYTVTHDADDADSGNIQITFIEHTPTSKDSVFDATNTVAGKASETRSNADDVNTNSASWTDKILHDIADGASDAVAYASMAYASAVNTARMCTEAAAMASEAADMLEVDGDSMGAAEIQSLINGVLTRIDEAVRAMADYATEEAYNLSRALLMTAASLDDLGNALLMAKPPLIVEMVAADIPLLIYAHAKYGDSSRADELLALNDFADPLLVPAGMLVRRYAV